jgi:PAS domain S-box-containing protein
MAEPPANPAQQSTSQSPQEARNGPGGQRAEQALRHSEERFRLFMENVQDYAIFLMDPAGRVVEWNAGGTHLLGYQADEVLGQPFARFFTPEDIQNGQPQRELQTATETGRAQDERWHVRKDGTRFWTRGLVTPLWNEQGELQGFAKVMRDLTEPRQARESLRQSEVRFHQLAQSDLIGLILCNLQGVIADANQAFLEIVGYSREQIRTGKILWQDLTPPQYAALDEKATLQLRTVGFCAPFEKELLRQDGARVPVLFGPALLNESNDEYVCFVLDLTERKRLERELHQRMDDLAEQDRRKNEFLAMLGHELRNPLAAFFNAVQLLRQGGALSPFQEYAVGILSRQLGQLSHLVDELLDVSRVTQGKIQLQKQRVDLREVVNRAVETMRSLIDRRQHDLHVSLPPEPVWLEADLVRLEQVFANLLSNAAKYTEPRGRIWLTVQRTEGNAIVQVRDTGVGISAKLMPRIFDLFTQAERSLDRGQGGLVVRFTNNVQVSTILG